MAASMYLQINAQSGGAVAGESIAAGFEAQIEVDSYSWGVTQTGVSGAGKGGSTGTANVSDMIITAEMDKSFPILAQMGGGGMHVTSAVLTICKTGGGLFPYHKITMNNGILTAVTAAGATGGDGTPSHTMTININFQSIQFEYTAQDSTGQALGGAVQGKINAATSK